MKTHIVIAALTFLISLPARSQTLTLDYIQRHLAAEAYALGGTGTTNPSPNLGVRGLFDFSVSNAASGTEVTANTTAVENSFISTTNDPLQFTGSGSSFARLTSTAAPAGNYGGAYASSAVTIRFTIDASFYFSLAATTAGSDPGIQYPQSAGFVSLVRDSGGVPVAVIGSDNSLLSGPASGSFQGVIPAGAYTFTAGAVSITGNQYETHDSTASYDSVSFSVQSMPEPSAATFLLVGACFCLLRRTLRTHERSA